MRNTYLDTQQRMCPLQPSYLLSYDNRRGTMRVSVGWLVCIPFPLSLCVGLFNCIHDFKLRVIIGLSVVQEIVVHQEKEKEREIGLGVNWPCSNTAVDGTCKSDWDYDHVMSRSSLEISCS